MDVTLADQENINHFSRLNTKVHEINAKLKALKAAAEDIEEAENELMLAEDEEVPYLVGECFFHLEKEVAEARLQEAANEGTSQCAALSNERASLLKQMAALKKTLYAKFGNAINLEE
ncbi:putative prefoldin subunit 4 [Auxenochlorella protothecoides]|uniref:Putative prefoldin subunit 4 n=1 Tax=Auxenochlorella protothecoides TaxID=3075 RepID=A0A087SLJ1_AUXPR|nr:putative prefoldin subunit 4 [Auxenochlorella protothecoides]KFM26595.1 putative prefoldin subunit 4 [Auxenochlorella protothecoides]RMZ56139.1 hypothetical protein APUTEX25_004563 [Auxenochlorella protothecoides]|eukprot:RMZ56139.1 hypothetical protein APUTEX25_004563 [Auxenochlorella protothecoides]